MPLPPKRTGPPKRLIPDDELPSAQEFVSAGRIIRCPHCEGTHFDERRLPAEGTAGGLVEPRTVTLTCRGCGRIEWYARPPELQPVPAPR